MPLPAFGDRLGNDALVVSARVAPLALTASPAPSRTAGDARRPQTITRQPKQQPTSVRVSHSCVASITIAPKPTATTPSCATVRGECRGRDPRAQKRKESYCPTSAESPTRGCAVRRSVVRLGW